MSRMDVKIKLELSYVMESYWDMLPNEIKGYILQFKMSQEKIDEKMKEKLARLCKEKKDFQQLHVMWARGPIKVKRDVNKCTICLNYHMLELLGCYIDENNVMQEIFLGSDYEQAMSRVYHVKSFL